MLKEKIIKRLDDFINEANDILDISSGKPVYSNVEEGIVANSSDANILFHSLVLKTDAFVSMILNPNHPYSKAIKTDFDISSAFMTKRLIEFLKGIRNDVTDGFLENVKGIITGEIFSNFLEMGEYLLNEGYKDAAAVIIGSVLENSIKELCLKNNIPNKKHDSKTGRDMPLNTEALNTELTKRGIYNLLQQKSVTAYLDLRNKAAHGKYTEYDHNQVKGMLQFVNDFSAKFIDS